MSARGHRRIRLLGSPGQVDAPAPHLLRWGRASFHWHAHHSLAALVRPINPARLLCEREHRGRYEDEWQSAELATPKAVPGAYHGAVTNSPFAETIYPSYSNPSSYVAPTSPASSARRLNPSPPQLLRFSTIRRVRGNITRTVSGTTRYRRRVGDACDSAAPLSPEEDELFGVDEDRRDDSTEPTDVGDLGEDGEDDEHIIGFGGKLSGGNTHPPEYCRQGMEDSGRWRVRRRRLQAQFDEVEGLW